MSQMEAPMNERTKRVMRGLVELSDSERTEVEEELRRYRSKSSGDQERYKTELRVTSGPTSTSCPCCGR
jgi:hypothetical protein